MNAISSIPAPFPNPPTLHSPRPRPTLPRLGALLFALTLPALAALADLRPLNLQAEYLTNPLGIDTTSPRLSWQLESKSRGASQAAYRIRVASAPHILSADIADLWDSGRVASDQTTQIPYAGKTLTSGQDAFWSVQVWADDSQQTPSTSSIASWTMGLLHPDDWKAQWISHHDSRPLHRSREELLLPPPNHFRKGFAVSKPVRRATLFGSALGIAEFHLNGQRLGDAYFEPGWSDYLKRAYYRTHDVTPLLQHGDNYLGAILAEGWYSGYVGYGLLVGYGPYQAGRAFYGKTPALLAQLEIEYTDGTRTRIITDTSWKVSADGPVREADLIMGEAFDARQDDANWCRPDSMPPLTPSPTHPWTWQPAVPADHHGSIKAPFSDNRGTFEVELGFQKPARLQAYLAPPIRITQELPAQQLTEPAPGVYFFDFGQNFAGIVRLQLQGPRNTRVQLRFGEQLHPNGRLMTENLRRARATDTYTLRGDPQGEVWSPRFTYHGFRYAELTGLPSKPALNALTGLALHNDTPLTGEFACSDEILTRFWKNTVWTQRANFVDIPTDCPQRDERLGWMGDAQIYVRTAAFNADVAAFFTKWLDDVQEAQLPSGAYPDYCPYPMGHGAPGQNWGTAWTDAGIICPHTIWQVYGDTRLLQTHWNSMTRFMEWRHSRAPDLRGRTDGNTWGDWLNLNDPTPIELIDAAYFALDARLMAEMADALGRTAETQAYSHLHEQISRQFAQDYLKPDGTLTVPSQTAHVLATTLVSLPENQRRHLQQTLAQQIVENHHRMSTGFLGTKHLLPALSAGGFNDLATRLFQSRQFPSWGYEVVNGATTVWERWDSYTLEHGFNGADGNQNASMNSFSHYAFGAVMEWAVRQLAGLDTDGPGFKKILIRPTPPTPHSNPDVTPIHWLNTQYHSPRGPISCNWNRNGSRFELQVSIPANTTATVLLPSSDPSQVLESNQPAAQAKGVMSVQTQPNQAVITIGSGTYHFTSQLPSPEL